MSWKNIFYFLLSSLMWNTVVFSKKLLETTLFHDKLNKRSQKIIFLLHNFFFQIIPNTYKHEKLSSHQIFHWNKHNNFKLILGSSNSTLLMVFFAVCYVCSLNLTSFYPIFYILFYVPPITNWYIFYFSFLIK